MTNVISFEKAISESEGSTRHLLLGNGFSIACFSDKFSYTSLRKEAKLEKYSRIFNVFNDVKTNDFEKIIKLLSDIPVVIHHYFGDSKKGINNMIKDADRLKKLLIETLVKNHPEIQSDITDERYHNCRTFLNNFLGESNEHGRVYTLNYDLLLYWVGMKGRDNHPVEFKFNDGFGRSENSSRHSIVWKGNEEGSLQRIHYLHGAIHLYESDDEILKRGWSDSSGRILTQVEREIMNGKFPIFVAEGRAKDKLETIMRSVYLNWSYRDFSKKMQDKDSSLFIFGHSLNGRDNHIISKIKNGKIGRLYISLHEDPESGQNRKIIQAAKKIGDSRGAGNPLKIFYYDAESARVWD